MVEINPVHRDGSTCFNGIGTSTVALAAGDGAPVQSTLVLESVFERSMPSDLIRSGYRLALIRFERLNHV
jgi:hypothetical protein